MRDCLRLIGACAALAASAAAAQPAPTDPEALNRPGASGFSFFLDNDVLLFGADNEDRNYTQGLALEASGEWVEHSALTRPRAWVDRLFGADDAHARLRGQALGCHALQLGLSAFTPERLEIATPQPDDRPYASILYLVARHQSVDAAQTRALTTELSLGVLGLNIADWFQSTLHEKMQDFPGDTPFIPQGWHLQVSDGGEPTARYGARWQRLVACRGAMDAQWTREVHLGYYTNAALSAAIRAGRIRSPWYGFSPAPITESKATVANAVPKPTGCRAGASGDNELYVWAGATARGWVYNALLQGAFRDAPVTVPSGRLRRLVGEYQLGVTATLATRRAAHSLTYAYARRSPEFGGPERRYHSWGGLYYSYSFMP